jgi:hypothetical protein
LAFQSGEAIAIVGKARKALAAPADTFIGPGNAPVLEQAIVRLGWVDEEG